MSFLILTALELRKILVTQMIDITRSEKPNRAKTMTTMTMPAIPPGLSAGRIKSHLLLSTDDSISVVESHEKTHVPLELATKAHSRQLSTPGP
jgi:hypothetical protein